MTSPFRTRYLDLVERRNQHFIRCQLCGDAVDYMFVLGHVAAYHWSHYREAGIAQRGIGELFGLVRA